MWGDFVAGNPVVEETFAVYVIVDIADVYAREFFGVLVDGDAFVSEPLIWTWTVALLTEVCFG